MRFHRGSIRSVLIIGSLAFKFPQINPLKALHNIIIALSWKGEMTLRERIYLTLSLNDEVLNTSQYYLFRGIRANLRERRFYKSSRLSILVPTYFSLFGLVNIQRAGDIIEMGIDDFVSEIMKLTNNDQSIHDDTHTLTNPANYVEMDGHLMIVDYGSSGCRNYLMKWGQEIYDNFLWFRIYS